VLDDTWIFDATVWQIRGSGEIFILDRYQGRTLCDAKDVNDSGLVVGGCSNPPAAVYWNARKQPQGLNPGYGSALAVNASGTIVGTDDNGRAAERPIIWFPNGTYLDIGGDPQDRSARATDINDLGDVVVEYWTEGDEGAIWHQGQLLSLPDLGLCSLSTGGIGDAINNKSEVVGRGTGEDCHRDHAMIWWDGDGDANLEYADINECSLRNLPHGFQVTNGKDINNASQIAAEVENADGDGYSFLLTPYNFNLSDPIPGLAGQVNTIQVTGLQPGQRIRLAAGFKPGAQALPNSGCLGGLLLIQNLKGVLPPATADNSGTATFVVNVPASLRGQTLRLQAYGADTCTISHSVDWTWE